MRDLKKGKQWKGEKNGRKTPKFKYWSIQHNNLDHSDWDQKVLVCRI